METSQTALEAARYRRLNDKIFWGLAAVLFSLGYLIVLKIAGDGGWARAAMASLVNLVSLVVAALPARALLLRYAAGRDARLQLAVHAALAPLFALLWYWTMMVLIGASGSESATRFDVRPFAADAAVSWQLLQGLTVYALLAALTLGRADGALPHLVIAPAPENSDPGKQAEFSRFFIRRGEDIHPVDVSQIVSITGADDYAEVATTSGRHLVRMTLGDFEQALESGRFIRVHRSRIVNVDRIMRAEPAGGGRLLLHMEDGEILQASRTGSRLLRDRVL